MCVKIVCMLRALMGKLAVQESALAIVLFTLDDAAGQLFRRGLFASLFSSPLQGRLLQAVDNLAALHCGHALDQELARMVEQVLHLACVTSASTSQRACSAPFRDGLPHIRGL